MSSGAIQDLGNFILDKFRHPNYDMRYLGASSDHAHLERDILKTLNQLSKAKKEDKAGLLKTLRGQVMALHAVSYYSDEEIEEILDKIDKAEEN